MVSDHYCLRKVWCVLGRLVSISKMLSATVVSCLNENRFVLWIIQGNQDIVFWKDTLMMNNLNVIFQSFIPPLYLGGSRNLRDKSNQNNLHGQIPLEATGRFLFLIWVNRNSSARLQLSLPSLSYSAVLDLAFFHFLPLTYSHSIHFSFNLLNSLFVLLSLSPDSFFLKGGSERCNHL